MFDCLCDDLLLHNKKKCDLVANSGTAFSTLIYGTITAHSVDLLVSLQSMLVVILLVAEWYTNGTCFH